MPEDVIEPVGAESAETSVPEARDEPALDLRAHYDELLRQAETLREECPDFDLSDALRDPAFVRLTAPVMRLGVGDAWAALHRAEREKQAEERGAKAAREALARAVSGGALRPREGGGLTSAALTRSDYASLSRPEQLALKQRIREAAARGEKIFP